MDAALDTVTSWGTAGLGAGMGFFFVRWVMIFFAGRWDKKEEQIDAGMRQLIEAMKEEIGSLRGEVRDLRGRVLDTETQLRECQRKHAESDAEVTKLRAMLQGMGQAREHAQLIVSAEAGKKREAGK